MLAQVLECFLNIGMTSFGSALLIKFSLSFFFTDFKCQLIVCQMSSTRCPTLNWLLLPLFLVVMVINLGVASYIENILLFTLTTAFTLAHIHYGVRVVSNLEQNWFHLVLIDSRKEARENFKRKLLIIVAGRILGYSLNFG